jgi:hypothetical protein
MELSPLSTNLNTYLRISKEISSYLPGSGSTASLPLAINEFVLAYRRLDDIAKSVSKLQGSFFERNTWRITNLLLENCKTNLLEMEGVIKEIKSSNPNIKLADIELLEQKADAYARAMQLASRVLNMYDPS